MGTANAQKHIPDSVRYRAQQAHYQRTLRIDPAKARKVAEIQVTYQDNIARILERLELDAEGKHLEMQRMNGERRAKLKVLLDPKTLQQLEKTMGR